MILLNKFIYDNAPRSLYKLYGFKRLDENTTFITHIIEKNKYMKQKIIKFAVPLHFTYFLSGGDFIGISEGSSRNLVKFRYTQCAFIAGINTIKKYYRLFYELNSEDLKKRKDAMYQQIVWPIYKLPITIQNPYV